MQATQLQHAPGQRVRVRVPSWLAERQNIVSRELEGVIEAVTPKAVLFVGVAAVRESQFCLRCKREIVGAANVLIGYCATCEAHPAIQRRGRLKVWLPVANVQVEPLGDEVVLPTLEDADPDIRITQEGNLLLVRCDFKLKDTCQAIPGAIWKKAPVRAWSYPATPASVKGLGEAFKAYRVDWSEATTRLRAQAALEREVAKHKTATDLPDVPISALPAWLHQRQAFWFAKDLQACMLGMGMGCGKSKVAVDLIVNRNHKKILIMCPKSVVKVWPKQFRIHAGREVLAYPLFKGSVERKKYDAEQAIAKAEALGVPIALIINYESAWREPFGAWALKQDFDMIICDESHRVKSAQGRASNYCAKWGKKPVHRLGLTGTPMAHSPLDIYGQYRFLDPGIFGTSYTRFRSRYAVMGGYGNHEVRGYQNEDELNKKFYTIAYKVGAEVLDLPEFYHDTRTFELPAAVMKTYKQLEKEFYAEVEEGTVTINNALTKLLRLQQVTSGYVRDDDGRDIEIDNSKADLLKDILDDLPPTEPVIVFCRFRHDLDTVRRVTEELKRRGGELSGRVNDLTEDSTMPEDVDIMAVQIQSGGVGIDLTRARYAIYYSQGFSLSDYEQSLKRLHRPGQDKTTYYLHLVAEKTVDEKVYAALDKRKNVIEEILAERE